MVENNKTKFIIGAFYTEDTPYKDVCDRYLLDSLKEYNFSAMIYSRLNKGSWLKNVAEKPAVILEMLEFMSKTEGYQDKALVFLDVDATIEKYPVLFDELLEDVDFAYHNLEWKTWYNRPNCDTLELLSGTLFLRNNDRVKNLLTDWYSRAIITNKWEQKVLEEVIKEHPEIKTYVLPLAYCYINSLPNGKEPYVKCDPVILHHQVSRKLKRIIK